MQTPVQVSFKGAQESDAVQAAAWRHAEELEHFFGRITSCRVVIESRHHHHRKGNLYTVRIDMTVPGSEIVINREHPLDHAHEDVYVAMRDAFRAARRRLEDHVRVMQGQVKAHAGPAAGRVARVFPDEGYGFISTPEGREVYFHRRSIVAGDFARLRPGDEVAFTEEPGEKGPQASSVHVSRPHGSRHAGERAR